MICQNAFLVVDLVVADFVEGNFALEAEAVEANAEISSPIGGPMGEVWKHWLVVSAG